MTNKVLALLGCQLLAFTEGVDVDKVIDVLTPAGTELNSLIVEMFLTDTVGLAVPRKLEFPW